jgi:hypothetical protein
MSEKDAISLAFRTAEQKGWPWIEPIRAVKRGSLFRKVHWEVRTNWQGLGCNVHVDIDDETGHITKAVFLPR